MPKKNNIFGLLTQNESRDLYPVVNLSGVEDVREPPLKFSDFYMYIYDNRLIAHAMLVLNY